MIKNKKIAECITHVGWIAAESAFVGALLHSMSMGYADEQTMLIALGNSMLRGAVSGMYSYALANVTGYRHTALALAPIVNPDVSTSAGASALVHATAQTVFNFVTEESGGFVNMGKNFVSGMSSSVKERWGSVWQGTKDIWNFMWSPMR
jgi:hypothetical protein